VHRSLTAVLDHVAIAVDDADIAEERWVERLGAGSVSHGDADTFRTRQLRFAGGGKLELLSPPRDGGGFVGGFLARFGTAIHHVTLKVPDLHDAIEIVRAADLDVVDVQDTDDWWQEGFLRPSQVGGLIVQLARSAAGDAEWADRVGHVPSPPRDDAATLLGPTIRHPDLDRAAALWTVLGATIEPRDGALHCRFPDSPLDVRIEQGEPAGPTVLRFHGTEPLPAAAAHGPAVAVGAG
jgi:catechol 2,3-dioxygenase-like lactoylglutathione lyase family enzyme